MNTLVLVTGACAGGWSWRKLAPLLRAAGHDVHTPTLTGLGERVHLARPDIDLDTHATDLANVLAFEELRGATLVGWSYGGAVITAVAERAPERLAQLIYLDAPVPADGQSFYDALPTGAALLAAHRAAGEAAGVPGFWPVPEEYLRSLLPDAADRDWLLAKMVPHPIATLTQPVRLRNPAAARLPRAYVDCTEDWDPGEPEPAYLARVRAEPGWRYRMLPANHLAPVTAPRATADLLLSLL